MTGISASKAGAVRPNHRFDEAALERWLAAQVPGYQGPLGVRQFSGGQSNPTFLLETPARRMVLRKQPPGELLPRAHAVDREHKVQAALEGTPVLVPAMLGLCEDPGIIGTLFYVMDHVPGRVIEDPGLPGFSAEERAAIWHQKVEVLAALHALDPAAHGLGDFGKPGGYLGRQVRTWTKQYQASIPDAPLDGMDKLAGWLADDVEHIPEATALVHGDYRMGNLVIAPDQPKIAAVLDWELATLGHPLADLAFMCLAYDLPRAGDAAEAPLPGLAGAPLPEGVPEEGATLAHYAELTGDDWGTLDPGTSGPGKRWQVAKAFAAFRFAAICQGVYARGVAGNAADARALAYRGVAERLAAIAVEAMQRAQG